MWSFERIWREKRRRWHSRDKLIIRIWRGIKKILKTLSSNSCTPQATRRDLLEFSFLSAFEERADNDADRGSDEGRGNSSRSLPPPPRFTNVDETYLPRQQPYDVNSATQLDHDTIDRVYTNFEEDLEDSQDVEEEELEETPTPTSLVTELPTFTRATRGS
ncbi:hypothetical protein HAX54_029325 [Datura stramonium]|uniref:Uncharacterized protein n=1 Tax=Datura stramonium TaxID=4076 RepID=A0ABS8V7W5_DATST|nr:hypothetical protein [Datura stramonium]